MPRTKQNHPKNLKGEFFILALLLSAVLTHPRRKRRLVMLRCWSHTAGRADKVRFCKLLNIQGQFATKRRILTRTGTVEQLQLIFLWLIFLWLYPVMESVF